MLVPLDAATDAADAGAKAERLAAALAAGLPVLPGWVVPVGCARPALRAGAAAIAERGMPAGRRRVLREPLPEDLASELPAAVRRLGGRVIARSSSPLESDARWSGAFSSVAEVGAGDIVTAVRSVWASAFALDPLSRLEASGLGPQVLEMAVLIQPEIRPDCGGTARTSGGTVTVEGVRGHPGALMSGWADGATATVRCAAAGGGVAADDGLAAGGGLAADSGLAALIGVDMVLSVAHLALATHGALGDNTIEWAAADGNVYLLQSSRTPGAGHHPAVPGISEGTCMAAVPAAPGAGSGRLLYRRPHEPLPRDAGDVVLLVDRPVPALAPLLFAGRGDGPRTGGPGAGGPGTGVIVRAVVSRGGPPGSHLAEVARALAVPLVTGCPLSAPDGSLVTVDGGEGTVAIHAPV